MFNDNEEKITVNLHRGAPAQLIQTPYLKYLGQLYQEYVCVSRNTIINVLDLFSVSENWTHLLEMKIGAHSPQSALTNIKTFP